MAIGQNEFESRTKVEPPSLAMHRYPALKVSRFNTQIHMCNLETCIVCDHYTIQNGKVAIVVQISKIKKEGLYKSLFAALISQSVWPWRRLMNCFLSLGPQGRRGTELPQCLFTFALFKWSLSSQHLFHITTQISVLMTAIMPALTHTGLACNIAIIHRLLGHFTLLKPPCTTKIGPSVNASPLFLCKASNFWCFQLGVVWGMQMALYLIGSAPKMDIKRGDWLSTQFPQVIPSPASAQQ